MYISHESADTHNLLACLNLTAWFISFITAWEYFIHSS